MDEEKSSPSLSEQLNAIPTPSTVKNPGATPGPSNTHGRITNSGLASQTPSLTEMPTPGQPAAPQQGEDVPQWMKNYASYQNNGAPAPVASNSYQSSPVSGDGSAQGGGYQIIMVVMILACVAVFGFLYINRNNAPAMPAAPTVPGQAGSVNSPLVPAASQTVPAQTSQPSPSPAPTTAPQYNPTPAPVNPITVGQPAPVIDPNQPQPAAGTTYPGGTTYPAGTTYPGGTTYPAGTTYPLGTPAPQSTPSATPGAAPVATPSSAPAQ